jgi:hypothetical protein
MATTTILAPGLKIKLVHALLAGQSLQTAIDDWPTVEIAAAVRFIFEKTVEIGILTRGKELPQEELLLTGQSFLFPAAASCRQAHICKPLECARQDNDCARHRLIEQIDRLGLLARTLLCSAG